MSVALTVSVGGFDYGFDFEDQRIDIDAALSILSVTDLYTAIKDAQDDEVAMAYGRIADASGLDQLSAGVVTFLTLTLLEQWEVNALKSSGSFEVRGGNLIRQDGSDPFRDNPLLTYLNNLSQAGVVAETGVSGLTPDESTALSLVSELLQADEVFDSATGLLHRYFRGTTTDIIPPKAVAGTQVPVTVTVQE